MDLGEFRGKVGEYRRLAGRAQGQLARELGLHPDALSHKLRGDGRARLNHDDVRGIVRALAGWRAVWTRGQAEELLALAGLPPSAFGAAEWGSPPLGLLEAERPGRDRAVPRSGAPPRLACSRPSAPAATGRPRGTRPR